jgi:hypothetical protein
VGRSQLSCHELCTSYFFPYHIRPFFLFVIMSRVVIIKEETQWSEIETATFPRR